LIPAKTAASVVTWPPATSLLAGLSRVGKQGITYRCCGRHSYGVNPARSPDRVAVSRHLPSIGGVNAKSISSYPATTETLTNIANGSYIRQCIACVPRRPVSADAGRGPRAEFTHHP
jgi:hypothetical protein